MRKKRIPIIRSVGQIEKPVVEGVEGVEGGRGREGGSGGPSGGRP